MPCQSFKRFSNQKAVKLNFCLTIDPISQYDQIKLQSPNRYRQKIKKVSLNENNYHANQPQHSMTIPISFFRDKVSYSMFVENSKRLSEQNRSSKYQKVKPKKFKHPYKLHPESVSQRDGAPKTAQNEKIFVRSNRVRSLNISRKSEAKANTSSHRAYYNPYVQQNFRPIRTSNNSRIPQKQLQGALNQTTPKTPTTRKLERAESFLKRKRLEKQNHSQSQYTPEEQQRQRKNQPFLNINRLITDRQFEKYEQKLLLMEQQFTTGFKKDELQTITHKPQTSHAKKTRIFHVKNAATKTASANKRGSTNRENQAMMNSDSIISPWTSN